MALLSGPMHHAHSEGSVVKAQQLQRFFEYVLGHRYCRYCPGPQLEQHGEGGSLLAIIHRNMSAISCRIDNKIQRGNGNFFSKLAWLIRSVLGVIRNVIAACSQFDNSVTVVTSLPSFFTGELLKVLNSWVVGTVTALCLANGACDDSTSLASSQISDDIVRVYKRRTLAGTAVRPIRRLHLEFSHVEPFDDVGGQCSADMLYRD